MPGDLRSRTGTVRPRSARHGRHTAERRVAADQPMGGGAVPRPFSPPGGPQPGAPRPGWQGGSNPRRGHKNVQRQDTSVPHDTPPLLMAILPPLKTPAVSDPAAAAAAPATAPAQ